MSFYKILSKYYDEVFKLQQATVHFLIEELNEKDVVLDMACSTFSYGLELTKKGIEVLGIDLNNHMIEEAEQKSKKYNVELFNEDIRNINVIFKDLRFKEIFCIGNSLVHLPFKSEIEDVIKKSYKILQNGGVFIVSIINYDRIIEKNIKEFPEVISEDGKIVLKRSYEYIENFEYINFNRELIIKDSENSVTYNKSVKLLPILKDELVKMFKNIGFSNIEIFGDFKKSEWSKKSYNTVIKAWK